MDKIIIAGNLQPEAINLYTYGHPKVSEVWDTVTIFLSGHKAIQVAHDNPDWYDSAIDIQSDNPAYKDFIDKWFDEHSETSDESWERPWNLFKDNRVEKYEYKIKKDVGDDILATAIVSGLDLEVFQVPIFDEDTDASVQKKIIEKIIDQGGAFDAWYEVVDIRQAELKTMLDAIADDIANTIRQSDWEEDEDA